MTSSDGPCSRVVTIAAMLPLIACTSLIFWLSSIPALTPPDLGVTWSDKVYHAIAFFGYGMSTMLALIAWRPSWSALQVRLVAIVWGTFFAMSDEWHQSMVINRSAGWDDVAADVVGLLLSTAALTWLRLLYAFAASRTHR